MLVYNACMYPSIPQAMLRVTNHSRLYYFSESSEARASDCKRQMSRCGMVRRDGIARLKRATASVSVGSALVCSAGRLRVSEGIEEGSAFRETAMQ